MITSLPKWRAAAEKTKNAAVADASEATTSSPCRGRLRTPPRTLLVLCTVILTDCHGSFQRVLAGHRAGHPSRHTAAPNGRDKPGHDGVDGPLTASVCQSWVCQRTN